MEKYDLSRYAGGLSLKVEPGLLLHYHHYGGSRITYLHCHTGDWEHVHAMDTLLRDLDQRRATVLYRSPCPCVTGAGICRGLNRYSWAELMAHYDTIHPGVLSGEKG